MYNTYKKVGMPHTQQNTVLLQVKDIIRDAGFTQIPALTFSAWRFGSLMFKNGLYPYTLMSKPWKTQLLLHVSLFKFQNYFPRNPQADFVSGGISKN